MLSLFYNIQLKSYKINNSILLIVAYCSLLIASFFLSSYAVTTLPNNSEKSQQILYHKLLGNIHQQDIIIDGIAFKVNKFSTTPATATTNNLIISPTNLLTTQNIVYYSSITNSLQVGTVTKQNIIHVNSSTAALIIGSEVTSSAQSKYKFVMPLLSPSSVTLANFQINNLLISGNSSNSKIAGDGIIITGNNIFNLLKPLVIGTSVQIQVSNNYHNLHIGSKIYGDIINNGQLHATTNSKSIGILATMPIVGTITNNGDIAGGYAAILINPLTIEATSCRIINNGAIAGNIIINAASITSYATVDLRNNYTGNITKASITTSNNAKLVIVNDGNIVANEVSITKLINNNTIVIHGLKGYKANDNIFVNNSKASIIVDNRLLVNGTLTNYGYLTANTLTMAHANYKIINNATITAQNIINCNISGTYTTIVSNSIQGKGIIAGSLLLVANVNQVAALTAGNISSEINSNLINNGSLTVIHSAKINKLTNNNLLSVNSNLVLQQESVNYGILSAGIFSCGDFINYNTATFDVLSATVADVQNNGYLAISKAIKGNINIEGNLLLLDNVTNTATLTITDLLDSKHIFYNNGNVDAEAANFLQLFNNKSAQLTIDQKLMLADKSYNEGTLVIGELHAKNDFINKQFAQLHTISESTINNLATNAVLLVDTGLIGNVVIQGTLDIDKTVVSNGIVTVTNIRPYKLDKSAILVNHGVLAVANNLLVPELRNSFNATVTVKNKLIVTNQQSQSTNNGNIIADRLENSYLYENNGIIKLQSIYNSIIQKSNGIVMLASYTSGDVKIGGELILNSTLLQRGTLTALEISGASGTITNNGIINIYNFNNFFNSTRKTLYSNLAIQKLLNSGTINVQGSTTIAKASINNKYFSSAYLEISETLTNNGYANIGQLKNSTIVNNSTLTVFVSFLGANTITGSIILTMKAITKQNHGLLTVFSTLDGNYNKIINQGSMVIKNLVNTQIMTEAGAVVIADNLSNVTFKRKSGHIGIIKVAKEINSMMSIEGSLTLIGNINHSGTMFCDNIAGKKYAFVSDGTSSITNNCILDSLNIKKGYCIINNNLILYNEKSISINNGSLRVANIDIKKSKLYNNNILEIGILHGGNIVNKGSLRLDQANVGLSTINGDVIAGGNLINRSAIRLDNGSLFAKKYSLQNTYSNSINIEKNAILAGLINDTSGVLLIGGTLNVLSATNRGMITVANITDSTITNYGTITLAQSTSGTVTIAGDLIAKDNLYQYGHLNTTNIIARGSITNFGYLTNANNITAKLIINNNSINVGATISVVNKIINNANITTKNIHLLDNAYIINNTGAEFALASANITLSDRIITNYGTLIIRGLLNLNGELNSYGNLIVNKLEGNNNKLVIHQGATAKITHLGKTHDNLHLVVSGSLILTNVKAIINATTSYTQNKSKITGDIFVYSSTNLSSYDGVIKLENDVQQIYSNLSLGSFYANTPVNFEITKYSYCKLTNNINSNKITIYNEGELDLLQNSYLWRYEGYSNSRLFIRINQDLATITKPLLQTEDIITFATNSVVTFTHVAKNKVTPSNKRIELIKASGGLLYNNKPLTTEMAKKLIYHQINNSILIAIAEVEVSKSSISANVAISKNPLPRSSNIALIHLTEQLLGRCQPINYHVDALMWHNRKDKKNTNISNNNLAIFPIDVALDKSIVNYSSSSLVLQLGDKNKHQQLYSHATNIMDDPALVIATEVESNISYSKREDPIILQKLLMNNLTIDGSLKLVKDKTENKLLKAKQDAVIVIGKTPLKIIDAQGINIGNNVTLKAANTQHALHLAVPIIGNIENNAEIGNNNTGTGVKITQMISGTITNNNIIHGQNLGIDIDLLDPILEQQVNPLVLVNNNTIINGINIKSVANNIKPIVRLLNNKFIKGGVLQTDQNTILEIMNYHDGYIEVSHLNASKLINFSVINITEDANFNVSDNTIINNGTIEVNNRIALTTNLLNQGKLIAKNIIGNNHTLVNEVSASANFEAINNCVFNNKGVLTVSSATTGNIVIVGDLQLNGDIQQSADLSATNITGSYGIINNKILDVKQDLNINYLTNYNQVTVGKLLSVTQESVNNKNLTARTITSLSVMYNTGSIRVNNINNFICNNAGNVYIDNNILGEVSISGALTLAGDVINDGKLYTKNIVGSKYKFTNNKYVNTDTIDVAVIDNYGELCINGNLPLDKEFINKGILTVNNIIYNKAKFINLPSATLNINVDIFTFNKELFTNLGKLNINNICLLENDFNNQGILEVGILNGNNKTLFNGIGNSVNCGIIKNINIFGSTSVGISNQITGDVTITSGIKLIGNTTLFGNLNVGFIKFASNQLKNKYGSKIVAKDTLKINDNNFLNYGELITVGNIELINKFTNNGKISCHSLQGNANNLINNSTITCNTIEDINIVNKQSLQVSNNIKGNVIINGELTLIDSIMQQGTFTTSSLKIENNNKNIDLNINPNSNVNITTLNNSNLNVTNSGVLTVTNNTTLNYYQGKAGTIIINLSEDTDFQQPLLATNKHIDLLHYQGKGSLITISTNKDFKIGKIKDKASILTAKEILINGNLLQLNDLNNLIAVKKISPQNILIHLDQFDIKRANDRISIIADITCKDIDVAIDLDSQPISIRKFAKLIQNYAVNTNRPTIMQMIRDEISQNRLPPESEEIVEYFLYSRQGASNQQVFEEMRSRILATVTHQDKLNIFKNLLPSNSSMIEQIVMRLNNKLLKKISQHFRENRQQLLVNSKLSNKNNTLTSVWFATIQDSNKHKLYDEYYVASDSNNTTSIGLEYQFTPELKLGIMYSHAMTKLTDISLTGYPFVDRDNTINSMVANIYAQYDMKKIIIQSAVQHIVNSHKHNVGVNIFRSNSLQLYKSKLTSFIMEIVLPYYYKNLYCEINSSISLLNNLLPTRNFNNMEIYSQQDNKLLNLVIGSYIRRNFSLQNNKLVAVCLSLAYSKCINLTKETKTKIMLFDKQFHLTNTAINGSELIINLAINYTTNDKLTTDVILAYNATKLGNKPSAKVNVKYKF